MELIVYEKDLLFLGKILGYSKQKSLEVRIVKDPQRLLELKEPKTIIMNLELDTSALFDVVADLQEKLPNVKLIGYCSHTNTQVLQEAKEIGINAMARSAFVHKLGELM